MYCTQCKIEAKATAKFCPRCGGRLVSQANPEIQTLHCPQCGKVYGTDYQFCANDGSQLQPRGTPPHSSPNLMQTATSVSVLKIVLLVLALLFFVLFGTGGYLYYSGRWMDIPVLAKLFTPPLTQKILENGTYYIEMYGKPATLKERKFETGSIPSDYFLVEMEKYAFGDLNGDGIDDAAVILFSNGGGSGCFVELFAMIDRGGKPKQIATRSLGDRTEIKGLTIVDGHIAVDVDNPRFYPGQRKVVRYQLVGDKLIGPDAFRTE